MFATLAPFIAAKSARSNNVRHDYAMGGAKTPFAKIRILSRAAHFFNVRSAFQGARKALQ